MGSGLSIFTGSRTRNVVVILFLIAAYTRYRRLHAKFLKFRNRKPPVLTAIGKVKTITIFPVKVSAAIVSSAFLIGPNQVMSRDLSLQRKGNCEWI